MTTNQRKANKMNSDLSKIRVGCGCCEAVGSDAYPYYVASVDYKTIKGKPIVGLYRPSAGFDEAHPWAGGEMVVEDFDPNKEASFYITPYRNSWCYCDELGKCFEGHRKMERISFNGAFAHRDPSF